MTGGGVQAVADRTDVAVWWAAAYNITALPLVVGELAWAGLLLPTTAGAVLMSLSTVVVNEQTVVVNEQLLRRTHLAPRTAPD